MTNNTPTDLQVSLKGDFRESYCLIQTNHRKTDFPSVVSSRIILKIPGFQDGALLQEDEQSDEEEKRVPNPPSCSRSSVYSYLRLESLIYCLLSCTVDGRAGAALMCCCSILMQNIFMGCWKTTSVQI